MKQFKGTKGEWRVFEGAKTEGKIGNSMSFEVWRTNKDDLEEAKANAKLIAAAPELLQALQDCLSTLKIIDEQGCISIIDHETYYNTTRNSMQLSEEAINKAL